MPDRTKNYQLPLPLEEEYYSIAVVNETTEKIDAQLRVNADEAESLRTDLTSYAEQLTESSQELSSEIEDLRADLNSLSGQISTEVGESLTGLTGRVTVNESKIATLWDAIFTNITGNPFTIAFSSLSGITVTAGVWNAAKARLEC